MTFEQSVGNRVMNSISIAKHLIVPEAQHSMAFAFDHRRALRVRFRAMLPAINLDDELCTVAGKICDEMSDWHLPPKAGFRERQAK